MPSTVPSTVPTPQLVTLVQDSEVSGGWFHDVTHVIESRRRQICWWFPCGADPRDPDPTAAQGNFSWVSKDEERGQELPTKPHDDWLKWCFFFQRFFQMGHFRLHWIIDMRVNVDISWPFFGYPSFTDLPTGPPRQRPGLETAGPALEASSMGPPPVVPHRLRRNGCRWFLKESVAKVRIEIPWKFIRLKKKKVRWQPVGI